MYKPTTKIPIDICRLGFFSNLELHDYGVHRDSRSLLVAVGSGLMMAAMDTVKARYAVEYSGRLLREPPVMKTFFR